MEEVSEQCKKDNKAVANKDCTNKGAFYPKEQELSKEELDDYHEYVGLAYT